VTAFAGAADGAEFDELYEYGDWRVDHTLCELSEEFSYEGE